MKTEFTKGKWRACCLDAKPHFIFAGEDKTICSIFCNDKKESHYESMEGIVTKEECVANAKLIAAAPELLESLMRFIKFIDDQKLEYESAMIRQAKEAIKKATE